MATRPGDLAAARIVGERFVYSQRRPENPEGRVPLTDHLRELRNCVVTMALALVAGMIVGSVFFGRPGTSSSARCAGRDPRAFGLPGAWVDQLVLDGPLDVFSPRVKVALVVG